MIGLYLNDSVLYKKRKEDTSEGNVPDYENETFVEVNKQASNKFVRDLDGESTQANNLYVTDSEMFGGDELDGNLVVEVIPDEMLDGTIIAYEVYTI